MLYSAPLKCLLDQRTMLPPTRVISLFNETRRVDFLPRHRYYADRIVCAEQDSIDFRRVENPNRRRLLFCAGGGCEMEHTSGFQRSHLVPAEQSHCYHVKQMVSDAFIFHVVLPAV